MPPVRIPSNFGGRDIEINLTAGQIRHVQSEPKSVEETTETLRSLAKALKQNNPNMLAAKMVLLAGKVAVRAINPFD